MAFPLAALAMPMLGQMAGPLLGGLMAGGLGGLTGGKSGADKHRDKLSADASNFEIENQGNLSEIRDELKRIARGPSAAKGILRSTGGQGFQVSRGGGLEGVSNIKDILHNLNFDKMKQEKGLQTLMPMISDSTANIQQGLLASLGNEAKKKEQTAQLGGMLGGVMGGGGAGGMGSIFSKLFGG